jgi:ATP-dependent DNA ligase
MQMHLDPGVRPQASFTRLAIRPGFATMEAKRVEALPDDAGWQFEPKWDGFRCLAFRDGDAVDLRAKSGKPLGRYFPEVVERVARLDCERFVIDGELVIPQGGSLVFDALQMRLHPAESRIHRLAGETPATFILFDMLETPAGRDVTEEPLLVRRAELEAFMRRVGPPERLDLSPCTRDRAQAQDWLDHLEGGLDGVICKRLDGAYVPGERAMLKVKRMRSADCVVGGFRYATGSNLVGSLLLGLYDAGGRLNHVGFTSTIANADRAALTHQLQALIEPPGFTGDAPGGPSRWSTERTGQWEPLRPELVVEVRYDHVSGGRFRHGTKLVRWRPDKSPAQCTCAQLKG